jgi:uncharacterized protein (DUF3820 family)
MSDVLMFGKFKGKDLEDVPSDYLKYLVESDWFEGKYLELVDPIENELKFRDVWDVHFYGEAR